MWGKARKNLNSPNKLFLNKCNKKENLKPNDISKALEEDIKKNEIKKRKIYIQK